MKVWKIRRKSPINSKTKTYILAETSIQLNMLAFKSALILAPEM